MQNFKILEYSGFQTMFYESSEKNMVCEGKKIVDKRSSRSFILFWKL